MTAVEWLANRLIKIDFEDDPYYRGLFNIAMELEKQQIIDFVKRYDNYICENCNGDGYTIEIEAECCMQRNDYCCGIPTPVQVQKECYCNDGKVSVEQYYNETFNK